MPAPKDWRQFHLQKAQGALSGPSPNYNLYHANMAATYKKIAGAKVLVIGCNRGEDCMPFIEFDAERVIGLDVLDETGINFRHERVTYVRETVESVPFDDEEFDFVYCFATMEHVRGIERGFSEMARVLRKDGVIYSVASPLWFTRQGPHWGGTFDSSPWIHLRLSRDEIFSYIKQRRSEEPDNPYLTDNQMQYSLDPANFNMRRPREYVNACAVLDGLIFVRNDIEFEDASNAEKTVVRDLIGRGYDAFDLFGLTHTFVARKV